MKTRLDPLITNMTETEASDRFLHWLWVDIKKAVTKVKKVVKDVVNYTKEFFDLMGKEIISQS